MPSIVWKGHLTFGLISIPVKLYRAARRERVRLHYVHRPAAPDEVPDEAQDETPDETPESASDYNEPSASIDEPPAPLTRVHQALVSSATTEPLRRDELLHGYEVEPDRYVVVDPGELRALRRRTSPTMEIVRSVKLAEIDPVFFETSYYVAPGRDGEKPYAILFAALRDTARVALARVGMHGREHVVIVRPGEKGLLAHTMFYTDEIRFDNEFRTDVRAVAPKELELAETFLEAIGAPFAPEEFKDTYREELQALIASRTPRAAPQPKPAAAPVIDILEALKKSIAIAKKPAARATETKVKASPEERAGTPRKTARPQPRRERRAGS